MRCPKDVAWLKGVLRARHLKAYRSDVSVKDLKNRKVANEVTDWCISDGWVDRFKLWCVTEQRYVPHVCLQKNVCLRSTPSENAN